MYVLICLTKDVLSFAVLAKKYAWNNSQGIVFSAIIRAQGIVLNLDIGHGLIYRSFREWIAPNLNWAKKKSATDYLLNDRVQSYKSNLDSDHGQNWM
ncbi:MAG: hypothetical protein ACI8ZB_002722 [Desulforhopalus sp.]